MKDTLRNINTKDMGLKVARNRVAEILRAGVVITALAAFGGRNADTQAYQMPNFPTNSQTDNGPRDYTINGVSLQTELKIVQADALPENLPEHISYSEASAQTLIAEGGTVRVLKHLKRGDILQMFSQKIGAAGTTIEVDSTNDPRISAVQTIVAATEMDVEIKAYSERPLWMAIEHTPNTDIAALANDAIVSNAVQMQRATIKGNCTPDGCQTVRRNISLGHKDQDGVTRFDLVADDVVKVQ